MIERATHILERWQMAVDTIERTPNAFSPVADKLRELFIPKLALQKYLPAYQNNPRLFVEAVDKSYECSDGQGYIGSDVYRMCEDDRNSPPERLPLVFIDGKILMYADRVEGDARRVSPYNENFVVWGKSMYRSGAQLEFYYTYAHCYNLTNQPSANDDPGTVPQSTVDVNKQRPAPIWTGPRDQLRTHLRPARYPTTPRRCQTPVDGCSGILAAAMGRLLAWEAIRQA